MSPDPSDDQDADSSQGANAAIQPSIPRSRKILIGVNLAIAALILGKALLDPTVGQPQAVELPDTVELEQWDFSGSESLEPFTLATGESDHSLEGQRYTYTSSVNTAATGSTQDLTLTIELRYMLETSGFIERLLMGHSEFPEQLAAVDPRPLVREIRCAP